MDALTHPLFLVALSSLMTWAACGHWYRRKLRTCRLHISRLRSEASQIETQLKDAKLQIRALKTALAVPASKGASRPVVPTTGAAPGLWSPLRPGSTQIDIETGDTSEEPMHPGHGFADTLPFSQFKK